MHQCPSSEDYILITSNFVTFVVAYAPTEKVPEGQKAKYMAALNSTVAATFAQDYVMVLTDTNARTGRRGRGGVEPDIKVLGSYGRELLLGLAEDNDLAILNTFFCFPNVAYPTRSKTPTTARENTFGLHPDKEVGGASTDPLR